MAKYGLSGISEMHPLPDMTRTYQNDANAPNRTFALLKTISLEVFQRQRRPSLERLDCNVAADFAHNWQVE